ncbi:MAG: HlyD family secretion protein [Gammaproteobacteria bacterium]|nr:HlyD family secretion protein [Gammaproteobacteria bacterium]
MKALRWLLAVLLIAGTAAGFVRYWQFRTLHPATDDAYVQAHIVRVSSRVTAPAKTIHVADNQFVRAGEPLFEQSPRMFEAELAEARAKLDVAALDTGAGGADVRAASATLRERRVTADNARRTLTRLQALAKRGLAAQQALDDALAAHNEARAQVTSAIAGLERAREALGSRGPENARLRRAAAEVQQAELNLSFTHVVAAADGWVTEHRLRTGTMVHAGQTVFALVEAGEWWVEANFRETDLTRIRVGQPVRIELDMYPDMALTGRVANVSAGSGATFSLLPPENATGNWVKVTQRFPVRIAIDALPVDPGTPLRVGSSATVVVDTTALDSAASTAGP